MDSIDFSNVVIMPNGKLSEYLKRIADQPNSLEIKTLSIEEFSDIVNEESIYYETFEILDDKFNTEYILIRQDFEDCLDNGKLDTLVELYDEIYIDSIRYCTAEQLGKNVTVLLFD